METFGIMQDVYLTGNPQITFWKVVYRRHTNFSMEAVEHTLNGNPDFGRSATVTILRNGDLAGRTCLKVELKAVDLQAAFGACEEAPKVAYVRRLGHALIKEVEVEIGGSRIDRQYGVWMDVWYELTHTTSKERGYRAMIGDVEALTKLRTVNSSASSDPAVEDDELPAYTLYVPLQFWFNRNPGLALPLIALQYHEVRLNFEFEDIQKLVVWSGASAPDYRQFGFANASILVDYIYLDSEERRRFAQVGHEYLIEQLQFTGVESVTGSNTKLKLGFNHPCKEIVWALRNGAFNGSTLKKGGNRFLAYTHDDALWTGEASALQDAADNLARGMVWVNGTPDADWEAKAISLPSVGTSCTQVLEWGSESVKVTVVVSDSGVPCSGSSASASASASAIHIVRYGLRDLNIKNCPVRNLGANKISEITISVEVNANGVDCYGARADAHSLTLGDISVPVACFNTDCRSTSDNGLNPYDVSVVQLSNYGLRLDGAGNPVELANVQLNGHDRFDPLDGNYFNYVQPDAHHTRTPADGVNVYSFALHPEQHQPSGTANLSRIDNTQLNVTFADTIRNNNEACLDLFSGSLFYVWAINYNVLRIMSGMGGFFQKKQKYMPSALLFVTELVPKAIRHYEASHNGKIVWTLAKLLNTMSIASELIIACETPCRSGNPLEPIVLRSCDESPRLAENKNSGIVKINRIGQSACLLPKSYLITHGRASETERVTVDSLVIDYWLKIQSTPLEKFRGIKEPMPTKRHIYLCYSYLYYGFYSKYLNNKLIII